jgi:hypothetical protein
MRRDHVGMVLFCLGMFITMCSVGGMEQQPDHLLAQVIAAAVGMLIMYVGVTQIRDAE